MMFSFDLDFVRGVWPGGRDVQIIKVSMVTGVRELYEITWGVHVLWRGPNMGFLT